MEPIVNMEENIGKTVGRRRPPRDAVKYAMGLQRTASALSKTWGRGLSVKGVFRFKSHEEADEWMVKMMSRPLKEPS